MDAHLKALVDAGDAMRKRFSPCGTKGCPICAGPQVWDDAKKALLAQSAPPADRLDNQLREILCERCLGTGIYSGDDALPEEAPPNPCSVCKGKGKITPAPPAEPPPVTGVVNTALLANLVKELRESKYICEEDVADAVEAIMRTAGAATEMINPATGHTFRCDQQGSEDPCICPPKK